MSTQKETIKVFVTGATGYVGGSVLQQLLNDNKDASKKYHYQLSGLVRREDAAKQLKELGVTPILGGFDDTELLTKTSTDNDVVIHTWSDHLPATKAILNGLAAPRDASSKRKRLYINTSGTGNLINFTDKGNVASEQIYSDLDAARIHALPVTNPHRDVDSYILEFGEAHPENLETINIFPPTIFGKSSATFNHARSIQIPGIISQYVANKSAASVGKGSNIWSAVHIDDVALFFSFILEKALNGEADTGREGLYFIEEGQEYNYIDLYKAITKELHARKIIDSEDIKELNTDEEYKKFFGDFGFYYGTNSRSRAERGRKLGWKATHHETIFDTIKDEIDVVLKAKSH